MKLLDYVVATLICSGVVYSVLVYTEHRDDAIKEKACSFMFGNYIQVHTCMQSPVWDMDVKELSKPKPLPQEASHE